MERPMRNPISPEVSQRDVNELLYDQRWDTEEINPVPWAEEDS